MVDSRATASRCRHGLVQVTPVGAIEPSPSAVTAAVNPNVVDPLSPTVTSPWKPVPQLLTSRYVAVQPPGRLLGDGLGDAVDGDGVSAGRRVYR
ncbi:hypothetical protein [Microbispora sp. NPDC046933]|uniref:hypothetical protein n=1 Tax=Microbispora sp. NPDC046933 TaxID=3155618 RepID=UPI0033EC03E2